MQQCLQGSSGRQLSAFINLIVKPADWMTLQWPGCNIPTKTCLQGSSEGCHFSCMTAQLWAVPAVRDRPWRVGQAQLQNHVSSSLTCLLHFAILVSIKAGLHACLSAGGFHDMKQSYLLYRCAIVD